MRVLVLGTSNAILKGGYVDGLKAALPHLEIVNKSIGASPGTQFSCYCVDNLSEYGCVIFDSVVNDENQFSYIGTDEFLETILFDIMSTISAQSMLFVIGFCNERNFANKSKQFAIHERCAIRCGAVFCDVHEFFKQSHEYGPVFIDQGTHLSSDIAFKFGVYLAKKIMYTPMINIHPVSIKRKFSVYDASLLCKKSYEKKNSLTKWQFGVLENYGSNINIVDIDRNSLSSGNNIILGLYIDQFNTNCTVRISSLYTELRDISMRYYLGKNELLVKFVPFKGGALGNMISIVDGLGEPSPHEINPSISQNGFCASVSKIVCWKPN